MSKSKGNTIDPAAVVEELGADALRFYCAREVAFGQDGVVSLGALRSRYETELANDYGNLASRTLAMVARYRDAVIPAADADPELGDDFEGLREEVCELLDRAELTQALDRIWQRVRRLNRYVEEQAPWQMAKDDARAAELDVTLRSLAEGLRVVTVLLAPYMPEATGRLLAALGEPDAIGLEHAAYGARPGGASVEKLPPLFPKQQP